ncbi:MAG: hypothetical protein AABW81_02930 [Nanoarchaeota archaeon]
MDSVKEAFQNVKRDILYLKQELVNLREDINKTNNNLKELVFITGKIVREFEDIKKTHKNNKLHPININLPTTTQEDKNQLDTPKNPTDNSPFNPLKPKKQDFSTGNEGVPTDRQTNQQTNQQTKNKEIDHNNSLNNAFEILSSLDNLKKEIRLKFKRLTNQEFLVFSTIYQLDEEQKNIDYKLLSETLNLSESSIREYVGKLIKKGIPVDKHKINNKSVLISISPNLKKITTLSTILQLREI